MTNQWVGSWALAFFVSLEVIAHGKQSIKALPAPRLCSTDSGWLVSCPQAKARSPAGECGLAQLVQPADLGQTASARSAVEGTVLSEMCRKWHSNLRYSG